MKTVERKFMIEVTAEEVGDIADALHAFYMARRDKDHGSELAIAQWTRVRRMRNELGNLIGRSWCGNDA